MESKVKENIDLFLKWYHVKRGNDFLKRYNQNIAWNKIQQKIRQNRRNRIIRWCSGIAACAIIAVSLITYYSSSSVSNDLLMKTNKDIAFLTSAQGEKFLLDSNDKEISSSKSSLWGAVTFQSELSYTIKGICKRNSDKHLLHVPKGGEYKLLLTDGSHIILNSKTNLSYPVVFNDTQREVYLKGEAFFNVSKDKNHPFIVHTRNVDIEVLGTQFNVNAYDEQNVIVTLASGSVSISQNGLHEIIKPGEQAVASKEMILVKSVNVDNYISWTKGIYEFSDTPLKEIVKRISLWYDVDIKFDNEKIGDKVFAGAIFRNEPLENALKNLSEVSNVSFSSKGNTIIISDEE